MARGLLIDLFSRFKMPFMLNPNYEVPNHLQHLVMCSVSRTSTQTLKDPKEDITYPVINDFLLEHRLSLPSRFTVYPQLKLLWKPHGNDTRSEIPDMALVNFRLGAPFLFRLGIESKKLIWAYMHDLPSPADLALNPIIMNQFHELALQAEDQAKAVVKNKHVPDDCQVPFLMFIGPYWTFELFGPFDEAQLSVRHRKQSDSGDYGATIEAFFRSQQEPPQRKLYLLGTQASAMQLEEIIASKDVFTLSTQNEAQQYQEWPIALG